MIVLGITLRKQFRTEFHNQTPINRKTVRTPHNFVNNKKSPVGVSLLAIAVYQLALMLADTP